MNVTKLREEFTTLQTTSDQFMEASTADGAAEPTADELAANETRIARMKVIQKQIDQHAQFAALKLENPASNTTPGTIQTATEPGGREEFAQIDGFTAESKELAERRYNAHKAAINKFICTGEHSTIKFGTNSAITTGTGSSALLPISVGPPVVISAIRNPLRAALRARGFNVISTTTSEPFKIPLFDDTANTADVIPQNQTGDNEKEPTVTSLTLGNTLYDSGTVWVANTSLNSLTFDLFGWVEPMLDKRIEAAQSTAWMTSARTTGTVGKTTAGTATVTYDELIQWQHSIPLAYRQNGVFVLSDGLFQAIRLLKDSTNNPIYQQSLRDDAPDKLLGWPVFLSNDLATPAAAAVSGIAIAADLIFIRDIVGGNDARRVTKYVNQPGYRDQSGIAIFANGDFAFAPAGVRTLKHAAA